MTYYLVLYREALVSAKYNAKVMREDPETYFDELRDWVVIERFEGYEEVEEKLGENSGGDSSSTQEAAEIEDPAASGGEPPKQSSVNCKNNYQDLQRNEKEEELPTAGFTRERSESWGEGWYFEPQNWYKKDREDGDELVRRKDAEQTLVKAGQVSEKKGRKQRQEEILEIIDQLERKLESSDVTNKDSS